MTDRQEPTTVSAPEARGLPLRPTAGPPVIGVDGEVSILRELLAVEQERLQVARRIEAERKIVFPETTVIVHDIERLLGKIREKERSAERPATATGSPSNKRRVL